jgi:hypothetical protein
MAALVLTLEQAIAVYGKNTDYRPPAGTAPWHEEKREWRWHKPDYPIDYKVPNFGIDHDIAVSQQNLEVAEKTLKQKFNPKKNKDGHYELPNANPHTTTTYNPNARSQLESSNEYVQTETSSDPICNSAGCTQYLHPKPKPLGYPVDYPVPNFGRDPEILTTFNSLIVAEGIRKHKLQVDGKKPKPEEPVLYNDNMDLDEDIVMTNNHME